MMERELPPPWKQRNWSSGCICIPNAACEWLPGWMKKTADVDTTPTRRHTRWNWGITWRPSKAMAARRILLGFQAKINPKALPLLKPVQDVLLSFGANVIRLTDQSPGADIAPLAKVGVPTLGVMQDARTYFNYHHTAADTLNKIVPQELREARQPWQ